MNADPNQNQPPVTPAPSAPAAGNDGQSSASTPPVDNFQSQTAVPDVEPLPTPEPSAAASEPVLPTPAPTAAPNFRSSDTEPATGNNTSTSQLFLYGFLVTGAVLVLTFYGALLWALWTGNASNPLFETLGIEAIGLKGLLLTLTNIIFGALALTLLITTLIFVFRWSLSKREDENRRSLLTRFLAFLVSFLLACGAWFSLYYIIDQAAGSKAIAVDSSLITTVPANVIGLSAPITISFDIGTKMFDRIPASVVRQINWDFDGDGQPDASGPSVTYRFLDKGSNNGRFPVTAEVFYFSNVENKEVSFQSQREVIIANENVSAKLNAAPETGPFPLEVEFNAGESKDPDGEVIMYEFDLDGDGEFEIRQESPLIRETFMKVGEYKIQVRVTGQNNDTDVTERIISVQTPESDLKAVISSPDPLEGFAPLKVSFDGSQSFVKEGVITQYEWFIEGETEPVLGRKLQRIFREPGEYLVSLTVQNDLGERQRTDRTVVVYEDDITAKVEVRTTPATPNNEILRGTVPFSVSFDASESKIKEPLEWQWDFDDDGITDEFGEAVQYVFRKPGTYEVQLTIVDSDQVQHESVIPVQVSRSGVTALINADPFAGPAPLKVRLDGSASSTDEGEIVNYIWEFPGREPINYGAQIEYQFEQVGNYVVKMSVLTSKGQVATDEIIVSARAPIVSADFSVTPSSGSAPLLVRATPRISKGIIREYEWTWGDGSAPELVFTPEPVEHSYLRPGTYEVKLRLTDQSGIVSEKTKTVQVQ